MTGSIESVFEFLHTVTKYYLKFNENYFLIKVKYMSFALNSLINV